MMDMRDLMVGLVPVQPPSLQIFYGGLPAS